VSYGIGIVGAGMIAEFQARAIEGAKGARLQAVLSRNPERAAEFGRRFSCKGYASLRDFLADSEMQIVSICTPSGAHLEPALQAIESGRHLIVEKPLEITLKRCDAIINAARKAGVRVSGVFQSRFYDGPKLLKGAVDGGRFGRPVLGDAYVKWFRSQEYYDKGGWKGTRRYDGGGALMNQSIHAVDLLQWYMGPVKAVQAARGIRGHERIEVEDTAVAALEFESGAFGVIEGSTAIFPGFLKRIELAGTRGSAILEEEDLKHWRFDPEQPTDEQVRQSYGQKTRSGGGAADPAAISGEGHRRQFESFVTALAEGRDPEPSAEEARKAVEIVLAIYRSADTGRKVRLR
jgi:UDP-N-acetyl-2-amino-2-deoxyglucuronate dehydrogenase